jgi:hypothetical protein
MADGLIRLLTADPPTIERWSENAVAAAADASWGRRAERIMGVLSEFRS